MFLGLKRTSRPLGEPETGVSTPGWGKSSAALQGPGHRPPSLESRRLGKDLLTTKWAQELSLSFPEDSRSPPSPLVRPVRGQGKKTRAVRVLLDTRVLGEETWGPEGSLPTSPQGPSRGLSAHSQAAGRGPLRPPVPLLPREGLLGHTSPQEVSQSRLVPRGPRVALGWRPPLGVFSLPTALALLDSGPASARLHGPVSLQSLALRCVTAAPPPLLHRDRPVPTDSCLPSATCGHPGSPTRPCLLCPFPSSPRAVSQRGCRLPPPMWHLPPTNLSARVRTTGGSRPPPCRHSITKLQAPGVRLLCWEFVPHFPGGLVASPLTSGKGPLGPPQLLCWDGVCGPG